LKNKIIKLLLLEEIIRIEQSKRMKRANSSGNQSGNYNGGTSGFSDGKKAKKKEVKRYYNLYYIDAILFYWFLIY